MTATLVLIARISLAAVLAVAAIAKLADREGSRRAAAGFGVPGRLTAVFALALPLAELATAGALLPAASARWGAVAALVLLASFMAAIGVSLARGRTPDCHCFGQLHSAPAGPATLARNAGLTAVAAFVAVGGWTEPGPDPLASIAEMQGAEIAAMVAGAAAVLVVVIGGRAFLHLLRGHGRLLVRLDELERRLDAAGIGAVDRADGLGVGARAPDFALPDLTGEEVSLSDLRAAGRPVLLLFSDPGCGPCASLMPAVAGWQRELDDTLTVAVVSGGGAEEARDANRDIGLRHVLLEGDRSVSDAYEVSGTPSAVLVATDGTIASPVHGGAPAIESLVEAAAVEEVEQGLPEGSAAPDVRLPMLDGDYLALSQLRGDEVLVLFWDPDCGFCRSMHAELRAWEQAPAEGAPRLLIVSSGSRRETGAEGFSSSVLLDAEGTAAAAFEATGTPMAVRVDRDGRVASPLAAGGEAVLRLADASAERAAALTVARAG